MIPLTILVVNNDVAIDEARAETHFLKTIGGILSMPLALLGSRLFRPSNTSCTVKWIESTELAGKDKFEVIVGSEVL